MKVYYEFIFIINYLLDFMILYGTKRLLKINKSNIRLLISSFIGASTIIILFINISTIELIILKLLLSIFMIIVSFGFSDLIRRVFYFYLISIIIGGSIYLLNLNNNYYFNIIILITISPIIIYILFREINNYRINYKEKYDVVIVISKKEYKLDGFIDTGNRLKSPFSNDYVILVNLKYNSKNIIYIPYKALNTTGVIPCIRPDKVLIDNKEYNNLLVGFAKDKFNINGINCILPNKIKEIL